MITCPVCHKDLEIDHVISGEGSTTYFCKCTEIMGETHDTITAVMDNKTQEVYRVELFKYMNDAYMSYLYEGSEEENAHGWNIAIEEYYDDYYEVLIEGEGRQKLEEAWKLLNRYYNLKCFL